MKITRQPRRLDPEDVEKFIELITKGMSVASAARIMGVTPSALYSRGYRDPEFKQRWLDAVEAYRRETAEPIILTALDHAAALFRQTATYKKDEFGNDLIGPSGRPVLDTTAMNPKDLPALMSALARLTRSDTINTGITIENIEGDVVIRTDDPLDLDKLLEKKKEKPSHKVIEAEFYEENTREDEETPPAPAPNGPGIGLPAPKTGKPLRRGGAESGVSEEQFEDILGDCGPSTQLGEEDVEHDPLFD